MAKLRSRLAQSEDLPALRRLMQRAIEELQHGFLTPEQIVASHKVMGLDTQLVADQTYILVEEDGVIAGCGGWSWRATLYGGDDSVVAREPAPLDPRRDAAKVRAMYTNPDFVRRGIGRMVLGLCEEAARKAGFSRVELMATMAGVPLYRACGYLPAESTESRPINGVRVPLLRMEKALDAPRPSAAGATRAERCSRDAVAAFVARFERGEVTPAEWTHAAHLIAGYWYVTRLGAAAAIDEMRRRICYHNEAVGTPNTDDSGYHESITRLYVFGIAAGIARRPAVAFEPGLQALLASPMANSSWPLQYYSRERLYSVAARRSWVEPDLQPTPGSTAP
ncbi:MAG: GNAT family N-acetyltransferase [Gammaproteobacteria bacterium]|nr:GNAT family N-acetyltransferase [Gammaproteobacteria bacterium]MDE2252541.1 GNAT family N-acetyltransferase [Gammaproteobacteria bacterium]